MAVDWLSESLSQLEGVEADKAWEAISAAIVRHYGSYGPRPPLKFDPCEECGRVSGHYAICSEREDLKSKLERGWEVRAV